MAHVPPSRAGHKPIIVRFFSRFYRTACLRCKKDFAPRKTSGASGRKDFCFPFFEDLTRENFTQLQLLKKNPRVSACWTVNGQIRYRLGDSVNVIKVNSLATIPE